VVEERMTVLQTGSSPELGFQPVSASVVTLWVAEATVGGGEAGGELSHVAGAFSVDILG